MTPHATPSKADFDGIYNQPDPLAYYTTLHGLDYEIPQHGADVFSRLLDASTSTTSGAGPPATVLDVCCSYGVGGALLTTDLDLDDLYTHYREATAQGLEGDELVAADRKLLTEHRLPDPPRVIGLDVAEAAIDYALAAGAVDDAAAENLETSEASPRLLGLLSDVDLVVTTGGIGYVTEKTIGQLVDQPSTLPWVAAFCLRAYDYQPIADSLATRGLHTERAARTFPQRRFIDDAEHDWAVSQVVARGLDPAGKEAEGCYHADFYLSRPARTGGQSLDELLPVLS